MRQATAPARRPTCAAIASRAIAAAVGDRDRWSCTAHDHVARVSTRGASSNVARAPPPGSRRPRTCRRRRRPNRRTAGRPRRARRAARAARITATVGPPPHACSGRASSARLQAVGVEARDAVDDDGVEARGGGGVVIVRQIGAGDEQRAAAAQRRGERVAERRGRVARSDSPSPAARSAAPGARRCRNGSCISSECSRACAAGCSRTIGDAPADRRGARLVDRRDAERRLEAAGRHDARRRRSRRSATARRARRRRTARPRSSR